MVDNDLEGIVAKNLADAYNLKRTRSHKILNRNYSQRLGAPSGFSSVEDAMPGAGNSPSSGKKSNAWYRLEDAARSNSAIGAASPIFTIPPTRRNAHYKS